MGILVYMLQLQRRTMMMLTAARIQLMLLLLLLLLKLIQAQQQQNDCFQTIASIQSVMQIELSRIVNGAIPADSYTFIICPNTFLDASVMPLRPILDKSTFMCGNDGSVRNRCVIVGGGNVDAQVRIVDSDTPGHVLQQVDFVGLTFSGFESNAEMSGRSIAAAASSTTMAKFKDCAWQDFASDFVLLQRAEQSFFGPMTVQIEDSTVSSGSAGVLFDNDGGLLRMRNVQVERVVAAAIVASANNAASFLETSTILSSDVNSVTYTTAGATQSVVNSTVTRMNRLNDAFYVEETGSTLLLETVVLEQNKVPMDPWSGVSVRMGAIARIRHCSIADNSSVEFGIVAFQSTIYISDTLISGNEGSKEESATSAPIFAITDAEVNLERVELNDNTGFAGGMADYVVFIANDSSHFVEENFVDDSTISLQCETTGPRIFVEQPGSGCFMGSSECDGNCLELASSQGGCLAQDVPTFSPTIQAPVIPPAATPLFLPTMVIESMQPSFDPVRISPTLLPLVAQSKMPLTFPSVSPASNMPVTRSPAKREMPLAESSQPSASTPLPTQTATTKPSRIPSKVPTHLPTFSTAPSNSPQPSPAPSLSAQPSTSSRPSLAPSLQPWIIAEDSDHGKGSATMPGAKSPKSKAKTDSKMMKKMNKMMNTKGMMMKNAPSLSPVYNSSSGKGSSKQHAQQPYSEKGSTTKASSIKSESGKKSMGPGVNKQVKRAFQRAGARNETYSIIIEDKARNISSPITSTMIHSNSSEADQRRPPPQR